MLVAHYLARLRTRLPRWPAYHHLSILARPYTLQQLSLYTRSYRIDKALPGKHTETSYKGRSKIEAGVLCQLRSGMCKLNGYLAKIGGVEPDMCECGRQPESVDHFQFRCPQWLEQRQTLFNHARKANRWGDLSFALGGWSNERKDGTLQSLKPTHEMVSATIKFAIATNRLNDKKEERELEPRAEGSQQMKTKLVEMNKIYTQKNIRT